MITLRQLVDREYIAKGRPLEDFYADARKMGGVCKESCRAAYGGTNVTIATAASLTAWAMYQHKTEIDTQAMERAPFAPTRRKAG